MILFCGILLVVSTSARERTASHVYVEDPKHAFHHEFSSDDKVVGANSRWIGCYRQITVV